MVRSERLNIGFWGRALQGFVPGASRMAISPRALLRRDCRRIAMVDRGLVRAFDFGRVRCVGMRSGQVAAPSLVAAPMCRARCERPARVCRCGATRSAVRRSSLMLAVSVASASAACAALPGQLRPAGRPRARTGGPRVIDRQRHRPIQWGATEPLLRRRWTLPAEAVERGCSTVALGAVVVTTAVGGLDVGTWAAEQADGASGAITAHRARPPDPSHST